MYNREKILALLREINEESKQIKPYVVVAQPRRDLNEVPAQKLDGYEGLHIDLNGVSHGFCNIGSQPVDVARNYLIDEVIESGAKYMLFVGEDTVLPYDGYVKLHDTAEKNPNSMVVGVYYIKLSIPMIMVKHENFITPANVDPGQIFEVFSCGLDAALIPVSILKAMRDEDPELPYCCIAHNIEDLPFIGEDNFFTYRLRKLGFKILADTNVQCLHCDLASGKYTAHPSITPEIVAQNYFTNFPMTGSLTMEDKKEIDLRWINRLPKIETETKKEGDIE